MWRAAVAHTAGARWAHLRKGLTRAFRVGFAVKMKYAIR